MLAGEVSFLTAQAGDCNRAFPFHKPADRGHWVFRWNRDTHVHVVGHQMGFDDLALLLPGQRVKDRAQLTTRLAEDGLPAPFGHEHDIVLAAPFGMGQALVKL